MSLAATYTEAPAIFLRPRPLARSPGSFILLPLLPQPRPLKPLPAEIWSKVLSYIVHNDEDGRMSVPQQRALWRERWRLLFVCGPWLDVVLPLLYTRVHLFSVSALRQFTARLYDADQRWDSIRRIPYSTPGRWVQELDLSEVALAHSSEALAVDSHLTRLFPLLPFLAALHLPPASRSATAHSPPRRRASAVLPRLEQLEVVCSDTINPDFEPLLAADDPPPGAAPPPLHLPHLAFLCLLTVPACPVFLALLRTPLPALRHLMVAPYDDRLDGSPLAALLAAHGTHLRSLHLNSPRHWPTATPDAPPPPLLESCPALHHLALDYPLPTLAAPPAESGAHPLRVLTIPRPSTRFLRGAEALLPRLPALAVVRARNVRWLRAGVAGKALEAGVQGEMREWRRRLARRGVRLVDGEWRDPE
ncbi:hypothetical protein BC834DRAFT_973836 [Gloeopeniophorella convolvens]|nr:hypothetical protein BC834DRAFT_973836 [Gloeopeniophorella convolvens]